MQTPLVRAIGLTEVSPCVEAAVSMHSFEI